MADDAIIREKCGRDTISLSISSHAPGCGCFVCFRRRPYLISAHFGSTSTVSDRGSSIQFAGPVFVLCYAESS